MGDEGGSLIAQPVVRDAQCFDYDNTGQIKGRNHIDLSDRYLFMTIAVMAR